MFCSKFSLVTGIYWKPEDLRIETLDYNNNQLEYT